MPYVKGVWTDEVLTEDARYSILNDVGVPINETVQIVLETPVTIAGTALTAARMNNIEAGIDDVDTALDDLLTGPEWAGLTEGAITHLHHHDAIVGMAQELYLDITDTIADNFTLSTTPSSYPETANAKSTASTLTFFARFISGPIARSTIPAGTWVFNIYASTSSDVGNNYVKFRVNKRVEKTGMTGTFTGSGSTRTFTVSGGTPFVAGDANTSRLLASLIETPNQTAWITGYISSTVVTVTLTDPAYVNEAGVELSAMYYYLFDSTTGDITGSTPVKYVVSPTQPVFAVNDTDRIVVAFFALNDSGTHTITLYYGGTENYTHLVTTFAAGEALSQIQTLIHAATSLPVPADADEIPILDSLASFGLKKLTWANLKTVLPNRNVIINGGMDVWQRVTSANIDAWTYVSADRWKTVVFGAAGTVWQDADVPTGFKYSIKMVRTTGVTSTDGMILLTGLESKDSKKLAGKIVTLSFYAVARANYSPASKALRVTVCTGTATDETLYNTFGTGNRAAIDTTVLLTTSWARYSATATLNADTNQISVSFITAPTGTAGADDAYLITGVQLELGSVATPFEFRHYAQELALCQRYFQRMGGYGWSDTAFTQGFAHNTTDLYGMPIYLQATMRTSPTFSYSALTDFLIFDTVGQYPTLMTLNNPDVAIVGLRLTGVGLTALRPYRLAGANGNAKLSFSAEL